MRNAVIMMTANPTEDVVADSPPSAPSGRFGGHPRSGRSNGPSRHKNSYSDAVSARGARSGKRGFLPLLNLTLNRM